jgi:hypothetical protein
MATFYMNVTVKLFKGSVCAALFWIDWIQEQRVDKLVRKIQIWT